MECASSLPATLEDWKTGRLLRSANVANSKNARKDRNPPRSPRNCYKCHEKGTANIPLPKGGVPTQIPQADGSTVTIAPISATGSSCHNKERDNVHMELQTASGGHESCVVCHGDGRDFAVEKVHAR